MKPVRSLVLCVSLVVFSSFSGPGCNPVRSDEPSSRPNILFIMSDDHSTNAISAYGSRVNRTPNIDRLAEEGAVFPNSFCANSICQPSRACVFTGKHSHKNGVTDNGAKWDGKQTVFPRLLKKSGYQTALFGKWHLTSDPGDEFDRWKILSGAGGQGFYYNPEFKSPEGIETIQGFSSDIIGDLALEWLNGERKKEDPFLLFVQFKAPHVRRMPALRHLNLHEDVEVAEPETLFDDFQGRQPYASKAWMQISGLPDSALNISPLPGAPKPASKRKKENDPVARMTPEQKKAWDAVYEPRNEDYRKRVASGELQGKALLQYKYQRFIKDYLRCVAGIDDNVGRLLDWLDESGLAKNTIVVYASDQSYYIGEHGWAEKRWMYEESLKMPFLIRWPGRITAGTEPEQMIQNIDYAPTFLEAAQLPVPTAMQGRSLLPLLEGKSPEDWRSSLYYHYYAHGKHNVPRHDGVRTERAKLVHYYTDDQYEMFDLEKDPNELNSIWDDPAHAELRKELTDELLRLRKDLEVPDEAYRAPYQVPPPTKK